MDGIFALGSNGEFTVVSRQEKLEFTKKVVEYVNHRVPVYAGPGACSTFETIEIAKEMERIGVDALSVLAPYFVGLSEAELVAHFKAVAQSVSIPVILYNIPRMTGNNITKAVFEQLAGIPNIVGIKDSSRDISTLSGYLDVADKQGLSVLIGSDSIIAQGYRMGAHGAIAGMSNLIPAVMVKLFKALEDGDAAQIDALQKEVSYLSEKTKHATMPVVLKRALERSGIAQAGPARLPVLEADHALDQEIDAVLDHFNLI